jgi:serine phosphatase RsbU (regulator of sigma subunit)
MFDRRKRRRRPNVQTHDRTARYGAARLVEVVTRHRHEPPHLLLATLFASVRQFAGGQPIPDDMTAVLAKVVEDR